MVKSNNRADGTDLCERCKPIGLAFKQRLISEMQSQVFQLEKSVREGAQAALDKFVHKARIQNMTLRQKQTGFKEEISALKTKNAELKVLLDIQEKKSSADCMTIL